MGFAAHLDPQHPEAYLVASGWVEMADGAWRSPLATDAAGDSWTLERAVDLQTARDAAPLLESRGWRLTGGKTATGAWMALGEARHPEWHRRAVRWMHAVRLQLLREPAGPIGEA
jgi:hypothetical protein